MFIDPTGEQAYTHGYNFVTEKLNLYAPWITEHGSNAWDAAWKVSDFVDESVATGLQDYYVPAVQGAYDTVWDFVEPHPTAQNIADFANMPSGAFNTTPSISLNATSVRTASNRNGGCN